jgi:DNA-binding response OmpR family regulator
MKTGTVLMLDDDPQQAELFCLALKKASPENNFQVQTVDVEFLARCKQQPAPLDVSRPVAVLVDHHLGQTRSTEILSALRQTIGQAAPLLVYTNGEPERHRDEVIAAGANDCFNKPMSLPEVDNIIRTVESLAGVQSSPIANMV